jgi:amidase
VRSPLGTEVHPDAVQAVERTARLLESLGHHVSEAEPAIDGLAMAHDFCAVWFAQLAVEVESARTTLGAKLSDFEPDTVAMASIAKARSAVSYAESYVRWTRYARALSEFLQAHDLYMTPALALPPPQVGERTTPAWAEELLRAGMPLGLSRMVPLFAGTIEQAILDNLRRVPFTQLANVTGVPAMSVPLGMFSSGLPLGVHFLADHGGEGRLLSLAGQLERAAPWQARRAVLP